MSYSGKTAMTRTGWTGGHSDKFCWLLLVVLLYYSQREVAAGVTDCVFCDFDFEHPNSSQKDCLSDNSSAMQLYSRKCKTVPSLALQFAHNYACRVAVYYLADNLTVTRVRRDCGSVDHLYDTLFVNDARGPNGTAGCPIGGTIEHEQTPVCMCSTENNCNSVLMPGQRPLTKFAVEASTPLPSPSSSPSGTINPGTTVTPQAGGGQTSTTVNDKPTAGSAGSSTVKLSARAVVTIICISMAFITGF